jgi:hypothetical protein
MNRGAGGALASPHFLAAKIIKITDCFYDLKVSILLLSMNMVLQIFVKVSLKMQEIALKSYRKKFFLGGSIYDLTPPPPSL